MRSALTRCEFSELFYALLVYTLLTLISHFGG